jgi:parallel beta-helix repeat protein
MMKREKMAAVFFAAVMVLGLAASAGAVDGTVEINQAKVLAAGGFPYTISNTGSYRLTGNLTVSGTNVDAIDVNASHVTIDLNGFSIIGPGSGRGIVGSVSETSLTVESGSVTGFTSGVQAGASSVIKSLRADTNLGISIKTGINSVVQGCSANSNDSGIDAGSGSVISGNTANNNTGTGIECAVSGCVISGNAIVGNAFGIFAFGATTGYEGNVLMNTTNVKEGTSLGHNLCSGVVC